MRRGAGRGWVLVDPPDASDTRGLADIVVVPTQPDHLTVSPAAARSLATGAASDERRQTTGTKRLIWTGLGIATLGAVAAAAFSVLPHMFGPDAALPVWGVVPDFSLMERSGRTVTRADFAGRPWVANFVFTSCGGMCPLLSARMAQLRQALGEQGLAVYSVSFSVDPHRDTPQVLREYAARYRADPAEWLFLTGERDALYRLIGEGFHLSVAERSPEEAAGSTELITHSDRFVLVDGAFQIRAYYHGMDGDVVQQVLRDVTRLGTGGS